MTPAPDILSPDDYLSLMESDGTHIVVLWEDAGLPGVRVGRFIPQPREVEAPCDVPFYD